MDDELKSSFNPAASTIEMETFIADAAGGDFKAVQEFLKKHAEDIDRRNEEGWSALRHAARYGHRKVVKILLENGATVDLEDRDLMTSLLYACRYGHESVVELLLEKGANFNKKNKAGWTSLMWAAKGGHKEITELLLKKEDLLLDEKNEDGDTALMLAVWNKQKDIVEMLLKQGASLDIKDSADMTVFDLAKVGGDSAIIQLLEQAADKRKQPASSASKKSNPL